MEVETIDFKKVLKLVKAKTINSSQSFTQNKLTYFITYCTDSDSWFIKRYDLDKGYFIKVKQIVGVNNNN